MPLGRVTTVVEDLLARGDISLVDIAAVPILRTFFGFCDRIAHAFLISRAKLDLETLDGAAWGRFYVLVAPCAADISNEKHRRDFDAQVRKLVRFRLIHDPDDRINDIANPGGGVALALHFLAPEQSIKCVIGDPGASKMEMRSGRPLRVSTVISPPSIPSVSCCACCGINSSDEVKLLICAGCKRVSYCSKRCQRAHWKMAHKSVCKK